MRAPTGTLLQTGLSALLGLVLLAGCTDEPEPGKVQTPTSTPTSASASASPTPTPTSAEAQIEATVTAYFEAANRMFETGEVAELRAFSVPACPCREITSRVESVYRGGGHYEDGSYDLKSVIVHEVEGETALAEVIARVPPYRIINGRGRVIEDSKGGKVHADYSLVRQGDRWIIGNAFNLE